MPEPRLVSRNRWPRYHHDVLEEVLIDCPACGEALMLEVDTTAGNEQEYVEDCAVCCCPMAVYVRCQPGQVDSVSVSAE